MRNVMYIFLYCLCHFHQVMLECANLQGRIHGRTENGKEARVFFMYLIAQVAS